MKFLRSNLQNSSQKFCKNLFDFEKPKNFHKSQKLRLKIMKCMNLRDLGPLSGEEKLDAGRKDLEEEVWSE